MIEHTVRLKSGRKLQTREEGNPHGRPIFWLHGTPGSRIIAAPIIEDAAAKGIRLIGYDRPGYGGSTPAPGRRVVDVASEVSAIADELKLDRFGVWGISGGGAPALACAATLSKRIVAGASLAGVAPFHAEGLDFFAGMGELNITEFNLMLSDQPAWEKLSKAERDQLLGATPEQLREMWSSLLSEVDRRWMTEEMAEFLLGSIKEGLKPGDDGMRDDNLSQVKPWGFELSTIRSPVQVWHGGQDSFVPFSHGQWIAARVPGVESHLLPNEGHLSLLRLVPEVHAWILSKF